MHALEKMRRVGMCGAGEYWVRREEGDKVVLRPKLLIVILLGILALAFLHLSSLHVRESVPREGGQLLF